MKHTVFTGVGTALITPFNHRGEILWEELEKLVELQISGGADAIIACGTTGEAATMSSEEHLKVIAFIIEKVKGRVPVIAGTGSNGPFPGGEGPGRRRSAAGDAVLQ